MAQHMLTTIDNPYDPFTDYDNWYAWDANAGYHTPSFLARIVITSEELSEADQELALEQRGDEEGGYLLRIPPLPFHRETFR